MDGNGFWRTPKTSRPRPQRRVGSKGRGQSPCLIYTNPPPRNQPMRNPNTRKKGAGEGQGGGGGGGGRKSDRGEFSGSDSGCKLLWLTRPVDFEARIRHKRSDNQSGWTRILDKLARHYGSLLKAAQNCIRHHRTASAKCFNALDIGERQAPLWTDAAP